MADIFICYSHKDKEICEELRLDLHALDINHFSDEDIKPGDAWRDEIEKALLSAKVAICLVSRAFTHSKFIRDVELPTLLERAEENNVTVTWILVGPVPEHPLSNFQGLNSLTSPLIVAQQATRYEFDKEMSVIVRKIKQMVEKSSRDRDISLKPFTDSKPKFDYEIVSLALDQYDKLPNAYRNVFAGKPWNEYKKCVYCGRAYSEANLAKRNADDPCTNEECRGRLLKRPFHVVDYYTNDYVYRIFTDAEIREGYFGTAALTSAQELLGFSWGFGLPLGKVTDDDDSPTVKFSEIMPLIRAHLLSDGEKIIPEETFYCAETGVVPEHQREGIGIRLAYARFRYVRDIMPYKSVVYRSVNDAMDKIYFTCFEEHNVHTLFNDPTKPYDCPWRYADLNKLIINEDWMANVAIPELKSPQS